MKLFQMGILWSILAGPAIAKEPELWKDGKITPEQPFRAKVVGSVASWAGSVIILKEEGGRGRYCVADLLVSRISYRMIEAKDFDKEAWGKGGAVFEEPPVEVSKFSRHTLLYKFGRAFGDEDFVRRQYPTSVNPEERPR